MFTTTRTMTGNLNALKVGELRAFLEGLSDDSPARITVVPDSGYPQGIDRITLSVTLGV